MNAEREHGVPTHPQRKANLISFLLFWWTNDLFRTGNQRPLQQSDFWPLHEEDKTSPLTKELQSQWNKDLNECNLTEKEPRLWKSAMKVLSCKDICIISFAGLLDSVGRFLQPFFLGIFISALKAKAPERGLLCGCAALMLLIVLMKSIAVHHSSFKLYVIGMRMKASLKGVIFRKILVLGQHTLNEFTKGHVIDLVSNDVQRMEQAARQFFRLLVAIFDVCVAVPLLWYFIGWQALMGIIFLFVLVPFGGFLSYLSGKLRLKTAVISDRRINLMTEIVAGIREVKTHAWEWFFRNQIKDTRSDEMRIIRRKSIVLSCAISLMYSSGLVAAFISILTLAFSGYHLTPFIVFTLLSIINVLRNSALRSIGEGSQFIYEAYVSFDRIQEFLLLPNLNGVTDTKLSTNTGSNSLLETKCFGKEKVNIKNQYVYLHQSLKKTSAITKFVDIPDNRNLYPFLETTNLGHHMSPTDKLQIIEQGQFQEKRERRIKLSNVTCKLNVNNKCTVKSINFEAKDESFAIITGPVGSGKSMLLSVIAGEMPVTEGNIQCCGTIAYVPQIPWVFSGTLRENIIFGRPFDFDKYAQTIRVCALKEDIEGFPDKDQVVVGERGNTLSGGQQIRVSLARAVYADCDIYLLDNPLAALDINVSDYIFKHCILGLLTNKVRLMVSHQESHMKLADQVIVLQNATMTDKGTFLELNKKEGLNEILEPQNKVSQESTLSQEQIKVHCSDNKTIRSMEIPDEDRMTGAVSCKLYWDYLTAGVRPIALAGLVLIFLLCQGVMISPDLWLSFLTTLPRDDQTNRTNVGIYVICVIAAVLLTTIRAYAFFLAVLKSSENLHNNMATAILKAPILFFDSNPIGRILNRFSKDIGCMDEVLPKTFLFAVQMVLFVLTAALLPLVANVWLVAVVVPIILSYVYIARYFMRTSRELRRLESVCRSPVLTQISETLDGLDTIRSRGRQQEFADLLYRYQDTHNRAYYMVLAGTRWLGIRLDLLSALLIGAVALTAALYSHDNALVGLAFVYVFETSHFTQVSVQQSSEVENLMTSVERVMAITQLESEPGYKTVKTRPEHWPTNGEIRFTGVSLRYYPEGPRVLKNLNWNVNGQSKIGIVGRTGAGKSSIIAAFLRMPEAEGKITIDGVELKHLNIQESRKCISVLNQSPVVFSGSLRKNLDPLEKHSDVKLWEALEAVQLKQLVENLQGKLDYTLNSRGMNLSVGEKQLICLARVLLQESKVVILDEPTAHVDPKTEQIIHETIREKLKNSTVITIAHRLKTIEDCDRIVELRDGQMVVESLGRSNVL
ncbi:ATP-binding cassette subfamily C member 4-like [Oculina patagonica]